MLHYYYGYGQGKTSTAVGLAIRAHGNGLSVLFVQFLKAAPSGEVAVLEQLGIPVRRSQKTAKFVSEMNEAEFADEKHAAQKLLRSSLRDAQNGRYDLVILDEVTDAAAVGILESGQLETLVLADGMPELILTGHTLPEWLKNHADYLTEYTCIRHPYTSGVSARRGFEM